MVYKLLNKPLLGELLAPAPEPVPVMAALPDAGGAIQLPDNIRKEMEAAGAAQAVFDNLDPDLEFKRNSISNFIEQEPEEAARFLMSFIRDDES
jgi:hypothetical protein